MNICTCEVRTVIKPFSGLWSARPQNPDIGDLYYATDRGFTYAWLQPFGAVLSARWYKTGVGVVDDFNRDSNSLIAGNAQSGQAWANYASSVWGISSNQLYNSNDQNGAKLLINAGTNNPTAQITMSGQINGSNIRIPTLLLRSGGDTDNAFYIDMYGGNLRVARPGVYVVQVPTTTTDGVAYTITARLSGNELNVWVGTTLLVDYDLSSTAELEISKGTHVGFYVQRANSPTVAARWDNFKCYEEAAA